MPKPTCQLNLTLSLTTAEWVERVARDVNMRPSGAGRVLLEDRLDLEERGWQINDKEVGEVVKSLVSLEENDLAKVKDFIGRLGSK